MTLDDVVCLKEEGARPQVADERNYVPPGCPSEPYQIIIIIIIIVKQFNSSPANVFTHRTFRPELRRPSSAYECRCSLNDQLCTCTCTCLKILVWIVLEER